MLKTIVKLLVTLIFYSCFQQKTIAGLQTNPSSNQMSKLKTGLTIVTTPTRGIGFTDSLGFQNGIVHVTNTITNDSTIPIHLQIDAPVKYSYPFSGDSLKFSIVLWPGLTEPPNLYSDSQEVVKKSFTRTIMEGTNQINKLLAPQEKYVVTIGTMESPESPKICSAVAYSILDYSESRKYSDCEWPMNEEHSTHPQLALGLLVGFCTSGQHYESCTVITCGRITYIEN